MSNGPFLIASLHIPDILNRCALRATMIVSHATFGGSQSQNK